MSSLSNDEIRLAILKLLHDEDQEDAFSSIDKKKIMETLQISDKQADFNIRHLSNKKLVKLFWAKFSFEWRAKITIEGIDVVEHKEKYSDQFPFMQVTVQTQNIQGNAYGVTQAADNAQVSFSQQINDTFQRAYVQVEKANIPTEQKEEINKNLKDLEKELQKGKEMDTNTIKKAIERLKQNANWVVSLLAQVVTEGLKIACGIP